MRWERAGRVPSSGRPSFPFRMPCLPQERACTARLLLDPARYCGIAYGSTSTVLFRPSFVNSSPIRICLVSRRRFRSRARSMLMVG